MEDKIKLCHVTSAHQRYDVRIFQKECKSLAENNYEVYLIVNDNLPDEEINNVKIISTRVQSKNRFDRMVKSKKLIRKKMKDIDAEVYHFHDPDLLFEASWIKGKGKKVIFDLHEDVPKQILNKYWIPKFLRKSVSRIYEIIEKSNISKFEAIISVTPRIVNRVIKINENTELITNYPILSENVQEKYIKRNSNDTICFVGNISKQYNHENIISAIENIDKIEYILAGVGTESYINELKMHKGWDKVDFLGRISFEQVKPVYNSSIAGMCLLSNENQNGDEGTLGVIKFFEFMEAGLPVICTNNKIWNEIIDKYHCGIAINPENIDEIVNAINYIIDNPDKAKMMGNNGREAALTEYNWGTQETKLLKLYKNII